MPGQSQPNIVAIMADDIGWFNIGAYHQGIMASRTPNLDRAGRRRDAFSPITMPKRAAPRAARTSLRANCPFEPG